MTDDNFSHAVTTKFILAVDKKDKAVSSVAVAGTFSSWTGIPLGFMNGCWEVRIDVTPGCHQYKFILDGEWIHDETKHSVDNHQGSRNNTLVVFKGANVTEVASSCLKNIKSGIAYREKKGILKYSEKREILKPVNRGLTKLDVVKERGEKEDKEIEAARIEAERTRDQDTILKDIREGLYKFKREPFTPLKESVDFVPKHLQTNNEFVNWGEEKVGGMDGEEEGKWKVGDECVAKWRGRYWYNGIIVEIIHDQVLVKYLDCGDEDYANLNELKSAGSLNEDGTLKTDSLNEDGTLKTGPDEDGTMKTAEALMALANAADDNRGASTDDSNAAYISKLGKSNLSTEKKHKLAPNRCAE